MIKLLIDDSIQEREKKLDNSLKEAGPAIVASCSDGILLATYNNLRRPKIKQVSGPIAFVGTGIWADFSRLRDFASATLTKYRFVDASERDFTVFDKIVSLISLEINQKFVDLYSAGYYKCELVFSFLGEDRSHDRLYLIDRTGLERSDAMNFTIPTARVTYPELNVHDGSATMRETFRSIVGILQEGQNPNRGTLEVGTLSRDVLVKGNLEKTYKKLSAEEIRNWLQD